MKQWVRLGCIEGLYICTVVSPLSAFLVCFVLRISVYHLGILESTWFTAVYQS